MTIGARIRKARQAAGISQAELAAALGITRSACSQWEADQGTGPRRERLTLLAEILGVSYAWLANGEERGINEAAPSYLNTEQRQLLALFSGLPRNQRRSLLDFLRTLQKP